MTPRTFAGFAAVTVAVAAAAAFSAAQRQESALEPGRDKRFLPGLVDKVNAAAVLEVVHGKGQVTLKSTPAGWAVAEMGDYPAQAEKVRKAAVAFADLRLVEAKTSRADRLARLDLDDVKGDASLSKILRLKDAGGQVLAEAVVGRRRSNVGGAGKEGVYVRKVGETQAWLAEGALDLPTDPTDWITREVTNVPAKRVARVATTAAGGAVFAVARKTADDARFAIEPPPPDGKLKGDAAETVDAMATGLEGLEFTTIAKEAEKDFKGAEVTRAEVRTFDGLVVEATIYDKDAETWGAFKAAADPGLAADKAASAAKEAEAINAKVAGWAYRLPAHKAKALKTGARDVVVGDEKKEKKDKSS
jgi:hypothetical protein